MCLKFYKMAIAINSNYINIINCIFKILLIYKLKKNYYFKIFLKSIYKAGHVPLCPPQDPQLTGYTDISISDPTAMHTISRPNNTYRCLTLNEIFAFVQTHW